MIYIGSDHGGFELKNQILSYVKDELKKQIEDIGCFNKESVDYPDIAEQVCKKVNQNNGIGILVCGTGIGMSMAANKINGTLDLAIGGGKVTAVGGNIGLLQW